MEFEFESVLIEWRGPAPFVFAPISEEESAAIKAFAKKASYGWGCIPVVARIGDTEFTTSIMPKDGRLLLPVKMALRTCLCTCLHARILPCADLLPQSLRLRLQSRCPSTS
jgi:hypothetical protein